MSSADTGGPEVSLKTIIIELFAKKRVEAIALAIASLILLGGVVLEALDRLHLVKELSDSHLSPLSGRTTVRHRTHGENTESAYCWTWQGFRKAGSGSD
jgi:hypothetical protein